MTATAQLDAWRGDFGDDYVERNAPLDEVLRIRTRMWARFLDAMDAAPPQNILEVGCNIGLNLRALPRLTGAELHAVEPNDKARARLLADKVIPTANLRAGAGQKLPFPDASFDLVFTSGVLIHVHPDDLDAVCGEIHRVSRRWILCSEYFSTRPESIPYRGRDDLLFKRDFGGFYLDRFPDLECAASGFLWRRTTGLDDATWQVFRKRGS